MLLAPEPLRRETHPVYYRKFLRMRFDWALTVCYACTANAEAAGELFGGVAPGLRYQPGLVPMGDMVILAKGLIRHGVLGNVTEKPKKRGDYLREFKAEGYVATAMAHLGASEHDAWQMTMTSYVAAMRAKYPPEEEKKSAATPNKAELDDMMEWAKRLGKA